MSTNIPPLPQGFTLDQQPQQQADIPPLPAGFTIDQPAAATGPVSPGGRRGRYVTQAEQQKREQEQRRQSLMPVDPFAPGATWGGDAPALEGAGAAAELAVSGAVNLPRNLVGLGAEVIARGGRVVDDSVDPMAVRERWEQRVPGMGLSPRTAEMVGSLAQPATEWLEQQSPAVQAGATTLRLGGEIAGTVLGGRQAFNAGREAMATRQALRSMTAEEALAREVARTGQSQSAAAAAPDITNVSPELRQAVVQAGQGGGVNVEAVRRHVEAESLPTPVRLTKGQATGDVVLLSREQNLRGRAPDLARHYNEQNKALADNLRAFRDEAGPEVFSANVVEHGDSLINAYRAMDEAANARIGEAYKALRDAAGGNFPIGAGEIVGRSKAALRSALITDQTAPQSFSLLRTVEQFAANPGSMRFEDFEALRTNLAAIQRSGSGLESRAAGIIREQVENLPLVKGAERLKELADQARALARQRFQAIEADPAYKAVVDGKVAPDDFVRRFVIGGKRDDLELMARTIPEAQQTLRVAVLDHLRRSAGLNDFYEGNFSAPNFNKTWAGLSPKVKSLMPPDMVENIEKLGRVASATTHQPRGSFVNNSNTFTAAAGELMEDSLLRNTPVIGGLANAARGKLRARELRNEVRSIIAPGAGIDFRPVN